MMTPWRRFVTYALLIGWSVICVFPVYWLAVTSIKPAEGAEPRYVPFLQFTPDLSGWRFVLFDQNESMVAALWNSLLTASGASLLTLTIACLAVYALTRHHFAHRLDRTIMAGILATRLLPPMVLAVPVYMMAQLAGLLDSRVALIVTYAAINLPVATWLLAPVFGRRVTEQEEAARLDGASHLLVLRSVLLPMLKSGIAAAGLIVFVLCWNEYLLATVLATAHAATAPVWLIGQLSMKEAQATAEAEELARFAAAASLLMLPLAAMAGLVHRSVARSAAGRS